MQCSWRGPARTIFAEWLQAHAVISKAIACQGETVAFMPEGSERLRQLRFKWASMLAYPNPRSEVPENLGCFCTTTKS